MSYTDPEFQSPAVGGAYPASFPQYSAEPPPSSFQQDGGWLESSALDYNSDDDAWSQSDDISLVGYVVVLAQYCGGLQVGLHESLTHKSKRKLVIC